MTTATPPERMVRRKAPLRASRVGLHVFLTLMALLWLLPVVWTIYASLRTYDDTSQHGYVSIAKSLTLDNYKNAFNQASLPHYFWNTMIVTIPALILILFFSACVAFVVSRLRFRFTIPLLIVFMAANLLPQQVILTPLYQMFKAVPLPSFLSPQTGQLYDSYLGIILIHVAFQLGFCVFVLANYMKTIPASLGEAARVDGASVANQFWKIILPLCRPALAAIATLEFTWIYNDFLWARFLMRTGDKLPITSALSGLQGQFFSDYNLLAAGSLITAIPTIFLFVLLRRQFISGLTLGATKG